MYSVKLFSPCLSVEYSTKFTGSYEDCVQYLRTHKSPDPSKYVLDLVSNSTGRLMSYIL